MFNSKLFIEAIEQIEIEKGVSRDTVLYVLKEAMEKAYRKQLGKQDDANVRVDIDMKKGTISMFQLKDVVNEVEDDFLQISLEEIRAKNLDLNIGDVYEIPASAEDLTKAAMISVKNIFKQGLVEAEKEVLLKNFKDKIGELIPGIVEKVDERSTIVNIGRTSVFLPNNQKIPGEVFRVGDRIKLYLIDVVKDNKGAKISVSRTHEGFLRRIFEEEIHEIFDGTVIIKNIAREAGERSKVAVYSNDPNVDPAGACIGPNGTRIAKVVSQLSTSKEAERIDIITYSPVIGIYIMESLKPADVVGVILNEQEHKVMAIVNNDESSKAVGKKGVNVRLASKLTGYEIEIKELNAALEQGIAFKTADELRHQYDLDAYEAEIARKEQLRLEALAKKEAEEARLVALRAEQAAKVIEEPVIEQVTIEVKVSEPEVIKPVEPVVVKQVKREPELIKTQVKTTKTLEDLERELEREKRREQQKTAPRKRPIRKIEKKEELPKPVAPTLTPTHYMDIYTEEELAQFDQEENVNEEEDIDFEEFEEYYDDEV